MHRTALGTLVAALALLVAALSTPAGHAQLPVAQIVAATTAPVLPAQHGKPDGACRAGLIALTFDDGPAKGVTPTLVKELLALNVPATFFMVGSRLAKAPEAGKLVSRSGFEINNHTWSHPQLTHLSDAAVRHEILRTRREMTKDGIVPGDLLRPPYGDINARVRSDLRALGLVPVLWTIDSRDWAGGGPAQIASSILGALRPHRDNIVLQHDGVTNSPNSVRAVPMVVRQARKRGYCFTRLGPHGGPAIPVPKVRVAVTPGAEAGPTPVQVRLTLDRATTHPVSLRVRTVAGTATPGQDFTSTTVEVEFPRGVHTAWFSVPVINDATAEPTETFGLVLDEAHGVGLTHTEYTASIADNDSKPPKH